MWDRLQDGVLTVSCHPENYCYRHYLNPPFATVPTHSPQYYRCLLSPTGQTFKNNGNRHWALKHMPEQFWHLPETAVSEAVHVRLADYSQGSSQKVLTE